MITYYQLLEVDSDASIEDIRKSFFALSSKLNPTNSQPDEETKAKLNALFEALRVLSDTDLRKAYDRSFNPHLAMNDNLNFEVNVASMVEGLFSYVGSPLNSMGLTEYQVKGWLNSGLANAGICPRIGNRRSEFHHSQQNHEQEAENGTEEFFSCTRTRKIVNGLEVQVLEKKIVKNGVETLYTYENEVLTSKVTRTHILNKNKDENDANEK